MNPGVRGNGSDEDPDMLENNSLLRVLDKRLVAVVEAVKTKRDVRFRFGPEYDRAKREYEARQTSHRVQR